MEKGTEEAKISREKAEQDTRKGYKKKEDLNLAAPLGLFKPQLRHFRVDGAENDLDEGVLEKLGPG